MSTAIRGRSPKPTVRQNYRVENGLSAEYGDRISVGVRVAVMRWRAFSHCRGQAGDRVLARLFIPYRLSPSYQSF